MFPKLLKILYNLVASIFFIPFKYTVLVFITVFCDAICF